MGQIEILTCRFLLEPESSGVSVVFRLVPEARGLVPYAFAPLPIVEGRGAVAVVQST